MQLALGYIDLSFKIFKKVAPSCRVRRIVYTLIQSNFNCQKLRSRRNQSFEFGLNNLICVVMIVLNRLIFSLSPDRTVQTTSTRSLYVEYDASDSDRLVQNRRWCLEIYSINAGFRNTAILCQRITCSNGSFEWALSPLFTSNYFFFITDRNKT